MKSIESVSFCWAWNAMRATSGFVNLQTRARPVLGPSPFLGLVDSSTPQKRLIMTNTYPQFSTRSRAVEKGRLKPASLGENPRALGEPSSSTSNEKGGFPWLRGKVPPGFWSAKANQRAYLEWLHGKLNYTSFEDWYKVGANDFVQHTGTGILEQFGNSPSKAVMEVYSEHVFLPWRFNITPKGFFKSRENRLRYIKWLQAKVGAKEPSDLKYEDFLDNHGRRLLVLYGGSPQLVLDSLKDGTPEGPEYQKQRSQFPKHYWSSPENQKRFLDAVGSLIGVKGTDLSPWYRVAPTSMRKLGCGALLKIHSNSPIQMLRSVYSDHQWLPWLFNRLPRLIGRDTEALLQALTYIESERNIKVPEDWYRVSQRNLADLKVAPMIDHAGGLYQVLMKHRPDFKWEEDKFLRGS